jgi:phage tail-like protein
MPDDNTTLTSYNYRVEIDGIAIGFSKVTGLDIGYGTISYAESPITSGSPGPRRIHMPGQSKPPEAITLEKGTLGTANFEVLYGWINSIQATRVDKKDVCVRLCDENGDAVLSWKAINAFPTKLEAPEFEAGATTDTVAIQKLTLMADRVVMELA